MSKKTETDTEAKTEPKTEPQVDPKATALQQIARVASVEVGSLAEGSARTALLTIIRIAREHA